MSTGISPDLGTKLKRLSEFLSKLQRGEPTLLCKQGLILESYRRKISPLMEAGWKEKGKKWKK